MDPELSCCSPSGKGKDWVTGQNMFGEITGGYVFECNLAMAKVLMEPDCAILQLIGQRAPFEIAVGMNGRVWINSHKTSHTIRISNAILNSEFLDRKQCEQLVKTLFSK
eukprot:GEZU01013248.1.p3 GENE.GEZU01013248.1~~GEZU01013248.1.p3  ORF type:complete len:109 (+),score=15.97 GEZU01013248.1:313-639(+)